MAKATDEQKQEAEDLGISFSPNIGEEKLQEKIEAAKTDEESPVEEVKEKVAPEVLAKAKPMPAKGFKQNMNRQEALAMIKEQSRKNSETQIVKITVVDKREASTATTAYFNNGSIVMNVPLDTWVEIPKVLVKAAQNAQALMHKETDQGAISQMTKKYVIEIKA